MADIHLGANSDPALSRLEMQAFTQAIDECFKENVDFILICGDLFHVSIPDLRVVDYAVRKLKQVADHGIPVYAIYGSHDFTPNGKSVVDIIESAGLIKRIVSGEIEGEKLKLSFFVDPRTGAKIVGISGRKGALDREYYEMLHRESLESEKGFKIFAFHAGLDELKPQYLSSMESIPISLLPKGFDYYAGGHMHERIERDLTRYEHVVFPGALFGSQTRDHEASGKGQERGLYIVSFDDSVSSIRFVPVRVCAFVYEDLDVEGKNAHQAEAWLEESLESVDVSDKVVMLRVRGELSGGKTSDINFGRLRQNVVERGAISVYVNRHGLTSKEFAAIKAAGEDIQAIESRLLMENIGTVKVSDDSLRGGKGTKLAMTLLKVLRRPVKAGESKQNYDESMKEQGIETLGLKEVFSS
jgi:DNA repair exonuclease SbcCD nuclease subunit